MAFNDFKDGVNFTDYESTPFTLLGGQYVFGIKATFGGGSVALQMMMPDGSSYINAADPLTADGTQVIVAPPGTYRVNAVTAVNIQGFLVPVPVRGF